MPIAGADEDAVPRRLERVQRALVDVVGVVDHLHAVPQRHEHGLRAAAVAGHAQCLGARHLGRRRHLRVGHRRLLEDAAEVP